MIDSLTASSRRVLSAMRPRSVVYMVGSAMFVRKMTAAQLLTELLPKDKTSGLPVVHAQRSGDKYLVMTKVDKTGHWHMVSTCPTKNTADDLVFELGISYLRDVRMDMVVFDSKREADRYVARRQRKGIPEQLFMRLDLYDKVSLVMGMMTGIDDMRMVAQVVSVKTGLSESPGLVLYDRPSVSMLDDACIWELYCRLLDSKL